MCISMNKGNHGTLPPFHLHESHWLMWRLCLTCDSVSVCLLFSVLLVSVSAYRQLHVNSWEEPISGRVIRVGAPPPMGHTSNLIRPFSADSSFGWMFSYKLLMYTLFRIYTYISGGRGLALFSATFPHCTPLNQVKGSSLFAVPKLAS